MKTGEQSAWEGIYCGALREACIDILGSHGKRVCLEVVTKRPLFPPQEKLSEVKSKSRELLISKKSDLLTSSPRNILRSYPLFDIAGVLEIGDMYLGDYDTGPHLWRHFRDINHNKVSETELEDLLIKAIEKKEDLAGGGIQKIFLCGY